MLAKIKQLSLSSKLVLAALVLGVLAFLIGNPLLSGNVTLSPKELAYLVESKQDHITVGTLADWIIQAKADSRLVDLNEPKEFSEYHIPGSVNYNIQNILNAGFQRNEKIVLYSNGGIHASQVWTLLKAKQYKNVYTLLGGLEEWKEEILFPQLSSDSSATALQMNERKKQIALYFGGTPQNGGTTVSKGSFVMPKMPTAAGGATVPAGGKKKKEGC